MINESANYAEPDEVNFRWLFFLRFRNRPTVLVRLSYAGATAAAMEVEKVASYATLIGSNSPILIIRHLEPLTVLLPLPD